jgi:hypothetical protein
MQSPNFDLAMIYDTGGAFEKVAAASNGQARRPGLADYAVHIVYGDDVPEHIDLQKVAEAHELLLDADRTGRAEAQMAFSKLEDAYLQGDPQAAALMASMFEVAEPEPDALAVAARAELERRAREAGLEKEASLAGKLVGQYKSRMLSAATRTKGNLAGAIEQTMRTTRPNSAATHAPMAGPLPKAMQDSFARMAEKGDATKGQRFAAAVKGYGREFAPELAGAGVAAAGVGTGLALGRDKKTTVVYR